MAWTVLCCRFIQQPPVRHCASATPEVPGATVPLQPLALAPPLCCCPRLASAATACASTSGRGAAADDASSGPASGSEAGRSADGSSLASGWERVRAGDRAGLPLLDGGGV